MFKSFIRKCLFQSSGVFARRSYSQEGEDMILNRIFENERHGFYVDIGAHHPMRFSNTYHFYLKGWMGINVDPMPGCMNLFNKHRPRDINLEIAIFNGEGFLNYYMFNDSALNTCDCAAAEMIIKNKKKYKILDKKSIKAIRLETLLTERLPVNTNIDFMSIDVEGLDMEVLISNNWDVYRPMIVLAEARALNSIERIIDSDLNKFMNSIRYNFIAKTFNTLFFENSIQDNK